MDEEERQKKVAQTLCEHVDYSLRHFLFRFGTCTLPTTSLLLVIQLEMTNPVKKAFGIAGLNIYMRTDCHATASFSLYDLEKNYSRRFWADMYDRPRQTMAILLTKRIMESKVITMAHNQVLSWKTGVHMWRRIAEDAVKDSKWTQAIHMALDLQLFHWWTTLR